MHSWEFVEEFVSNANRLYEILNDQKLSKFKFSDEEIIEKAKNDELFAFVLHLLAEELKCRGYSIEQLRLPKPSDDFLTIKCWFNQLLAGLICEPFPTVQYLLKQQNKPSVYAELDCMFAATKLLNQLAEIYDPNSELIKENYNSKITKYNTINPKQYEVYRKLSEDIKALIDNIFDVNVPKGIKAPFSNGPSFRFEILNYINFESKSEFKTIPIQFLDLDDGSDFGTPFGKRWARRLVAKSAAYDKIHFDPLKIGKFPVPLPKSLENLNLNFQVQLPESVGIDLLHQNVFDDSFMTPEFLDYSAFSMHLAKFMEEIPEFLTHKLKNTDIFAHSSISAASKSGSKASLASFRALLLATGIRGHLTPDALPPVDIHEILNFDSEETSACLLLGLAFSAIKSNSMNNDQNKFLLRLFSMHLSSFQTSLGLEIPSILQLSAALSIGIFKFRSFDRGISQLLLREIFRPLPMNVNCKATEDSPLFSIIPAITLGMCLMGAAAAIENSTENDHLNLYHKQFALDILNQLNSFLQVNIQNNIQIQHQISVLISTAFINIGNSEFNPSTLPWARSLPDLLDKPEGIVFWCHLTWRLCQWNQNENLNFIKNLNYQGCDRIKLNFDAIFDSVCNPIPDSIWTDNSELGLFIYACQCLTANSFFLALKFSGKKDSVTESIDLLDVWITKIRSFPILHNTDKDYFLTKIQMHLLTTYQFILLCRCILLSGSGDAKCWGLLRELMADPLLFKYGNGRLFYSSIGFLFSGKGRLSVNTHEKNGSINYLAVASLLCYIIPILPTSPIEPEFSFLPLLDSLWPFFMQPL